MKFRVFGMGAVAHWLNETSKQLPSQADDLEKALTIMAAERTKEHIRDGKISPASKASMSRGTPTLIDTGRYIADIGVHPYPHGGYYVGFKQGMKHPSRSERTQKIRFVDYLDLWVWLEFGTIKHSPFPHFRPGFDRANKDAHKIIRRHGFLPLSGKVGKMVYPAGFRPER